MRYLLVLLTLLLCNTIIYGQSLSFKNYEQDQGKRKENAEKSFKSGKYDQAISKYKEYSENVESEEKTIINKKIAEIKECKNTQEAAEKLFNNKMYGAAAQLYLKLFEKSSESKYFLDRIRICNKFISNNDSTQIKISIELINIANNIAKDENNHSKQQMEILQLILNEVRQVNNPKMPSKNTQDNDYQMIKNAIDSLEQKINNIRVPVPNPSYNFVPFGIKQFKNNQKALGYTFAISQIAVPVALGIGLESAANWNYRQHKNQAAQTLSDHGDYYKKYKKYHHAAIWAPVAAFAGIYAINVLFNYYCTKAEIKSQTLGVLEVKPLPFVDFQGNFGMGASINIKF
jgi:hypothetical protein